jgi:hypothetical protein
MLLKKRHVQSSSLKRIERPAGDNHVDFFYSQKYDKTHRCGHGIESLFTDKKGQFRANF